MGKSRTQEAIAHHALDAKSLQSELFEKADEKLTRDGVALTQDPSLSFFYQSREQIAQILECAPLLTRVNALNPTYPELLVRKEIEKKVIFDWFFDRTDFAIRVFWLRLKQILGTILVWTITFVPGIITLMQIYYFFNKTDKKTWLYLDSTLHLFLDFTLSTFVTCVIVTIIILLLAIYRIYLKRKGYFTEKWSKHRRRQLETIQQKELLLDFHFDPLLGNKVARTNKRWMAIHPEQNIEKDEITKLYKEYLGHDLKNEWKEADNED